jgi:hypothetical protein
MKVNRVIYNHNLREPDRITVFCGKEKKHFKPSEKREVGNWLTRLWEQQMEENFGLILTPEARVYYDIDWDCDHILYCKFTAVQ